MKRVKYIFEFIVPATSETIFFSLNFPGELNVVHIYRLKNITQQKKTILAGNHGND